MNAALQRIQEERASTWNRMTEIMDTATRDGRDLTAEERTNWDAAEARLTELTSDKERVTRQGSLEGGFGAGHADPNLASEGRAAAQPTDEERTDRAFSSFLRRGVSDISPEERAIMQARYEERAEGVATGGAGGYLVPQGFWNNLVVAMKAYGGIMNYAQVIDTATGNPLPWPSVDDTSNLGGILGENVQVTDQDIVFANKTLNAYTYTSNQVRVSLQLMQDSAFDLDAFVTGRLAERIGRAAAAHFATGTGTNQPQGVVGGVTNTTVLPVGNTTTITYDGLVSLVHAVDPAYRNERARFIMNDQSLAAIRKIKDSQNRPLWQPDYIGGADRDTILGFPVSIDQGLAAPAANATSAIFGDFFEGYVIRRALGLQLLRLTERYADFLQVGFIGFMRLDGKVNQPKALAALVQSAT